MKNMSFALHLDSNCIFIAVLLLVLAMQIPTEFPIDPT